MDSVCVTIEWGELEPDCDEREYSVQYHGNIVPTQGSEFSFWTSRDRNGNYREGSGMEGDIRQLVTGTVDEIKYLYEVWGRDSFYYRTTMYVTVTLKDWVMGDAWGA